MAKKKKKFDDMRAYLKHIRDPSDDHCWLCGKTPDEIRQEFFEYMEHPSKEHENLNLDDLAIITYKTMKPVCAACYFSIKNNPELVEDILKKPEDDVW